MRNTIKTDKIDLIGYNFNLVSGTPEFIYEYILTKTSDPEVREKLPEMIEACSAIATVISDSGVPEFFLLTSMPEEVTGSIMAHESYHILNMVFKSIYYKHQPDDELEAYMLGSIYNKIEAFINEEIKNED